ncbi:MAG TPA: hypothetical protein VMW16_11230 [Sedimentisphaerales bacterium]|nr:hypothetical protein [Sedimentisphaerales bacterium]
MKTKVILLGLTLCFLIGAAGAAKMPPSLEDSAAEPVKYVGAEQTDRRFYHGRLRHAVGVHSYQAYRANRTNPPEGGMVGWTYSHQPYLACWNNQFYLQYLSDLKEEHVPPSRTLLMTSKNGRDWPNPMVIFPEYPLPEIKRSFPELGEVELPAGTFSVMHQRMGFYTAPNGRLLTLAFYSFCPTPRRGPNNGQGLGRVVREIYNDGSLGPIYFIRYNRHAGWNETNTRYPFYKTSGDKGFIEACEALLADKLMTLQWQEEDMANDGFFAIGVDDAYKAFSWCHRPDGVVVGVWKNQKSALSPDDGKTWTRIVNNKSLMTCGAKTWIQRTNDGRYALVYNHSATRQNRFPMAVMTSDDCHEFDNLLCLQGEVPAMRYQGIHKNIGPQYIRGIAEGNGNPPGDYMWNTYSMSKEDIWVSRTHVPITGTVDKHVSESFNAAGTEADLELWNLHIPKWAPISIVSDPHSDNNKCLRLCDEEPYDYALAQRAFPESRKVTVEFRILMEQVGHGVLDFEVQDRYGNRPMKLRFDPDWISLDRMRTEPDPLPAQINKWYDLKLILDCGKQKYDLYLDGERVRKGIEFAEKVESLERLVFRTGPWRADVRPLTVDRAPGAKGLHVEDAPGADHKVPLSIYLLDDVRTEANPE